MNKVILKNRWDIHFFKLALLAAEMSKDPRHQVGCIIVDPSRKHSVGTGFNGFPRGIKDDPERYMNRELKLQMVLHAEQNAILDAGRDANGATLYCTTIPCTHCAAIIIQSGVKMVLAMEHESDSRYKDRIKLVENMFKEAAVKFVVVKGGWQ